MATDEDIFFYRQNGLHGYMSNFSRHGFNSPLPCGKTFNCSEQYFMYYKCLTFDSNNKVLLDKILTEKNPGKIKQYGRLVRNFVPKIWENKRYDVMLDALTLKFSQNKDILAKLINTGDKILYEAAANDRIWGIGFNEHDALRVDKNLYGENLLGKALMEIRKHYI
jgi:ribA/ribD-fused uncharacterized protein